MEKTKKINLASKFNAGAFAIIIMAFSLIFMLISAIMMSRVPRRGPMGRDWSALGLDSLGWDNLGVAFYVLLWLAILGYAYLKREAIKGFVCPHLSKQGVLSLISRLRLELVASAVVAVVIVIAASYQIPPVGNVANWRNTINGTVSGWLAPVDPMEMMERRMRREMEERMRPSPIGSPDVPKPAVAPAPAPAPAATVPNEEGMPPKNLLDRKILPPVARPVPPEKLPTPANKK